VVKLISRYFIPVAVSSADYGRDQKDGKELLEFKKLWQSTERQDMVHGRTVKFFVIDQDYKILYTWTVEMSEASVLADRLERIVREMNLKPRADEAARVAKAKPRPWPTASVAGSLILRVSISPDRAHWNGGPSEDWVELGAMDLASFAPPPGSGVGSSWEVSDRLTKKLYPYFYPAIGALYDVEISEIKAAGLEATLTEASGNRAEMALRGFLELDHRQATQGNGKVLAKLVGVASYDRKLRSVTSIKMVSEKAAYVYTGNKDPWFSIVVESEPKN
jgi:hypothetical protein